MPALGVRQVDDLRQLDRRVVREHAADRGQHVADRVLREVGQLRARQQLDDHRRQVGAHRIRGQAALFGHVDLLA